MIDDAITELQPPIRTRQACVATGRSQARQSRPHRKNPVPYGQRGGVSRGRGR
ncbi:hypothetical protein AB0H36_46985 [Kribbella sp. NPDC050820]|uniref:hypothetical protein n=1 Tax=Kribbella sp. NPDC050820 TaxID=3155408 RepID=UPI0033D65482